MDEDKVSASFQRFLELGMFTKSVTGSLYGSIHINYRELYGNDEELTNMILIEPDEYFPFLDTQISSLFGDSAPTNLNLRIHGIPEMNLRHLSSKDVNKFISLKGIVTRVVEVRPMVTKAAFRCQRCGEISWLNQSDNNLIEYPPKCEHGDCKKASFSNFSFDDSQSTFIDSQEVTIQESQDELPAGQIPRNLPLLLKNDLIEEIRAGDRVTVSGMIRIKKTNKILKYVTFSTFMEVNSFDVDSKEPSEMELTEADIQKITELSKQTDIFDRLVNSLVPSIYGYHDIKEAILYLLFGGVKYEKPDGIFRGEINVLLVGDPACAKSQLLRGVIRYCPRGIYTSGMGSSTAGLTVAVIKQENGLYALEAGALVLGDKGVVCIDEIDKMKKEDRLNIHTAMEQHIIPINKGGINATLNARCAILAAANPVYSRYDDARTVAENLGFQSTLLSRFDLIFIIKDRPSEEFDRNIAKHVLSLRKQTLILESTIPIDLMKKYVAYARRLNPELTSEAQEVLEKFYSSMRRSLTEANDTIPITARQLEGLARLAEAHAKIALRDRVTTDDAQAAVTIMMKSLNQCNIDPQTGKMDSAITARGMTRNKDTLKAQAIDILRKESDSQDNDIGMTREEWTGALMDASGSDKDECTKIVQQIINAGIQVYSPTNGYYKILT